MKHIYLILKILHTANQNGEVMEFEDFPLDKLEINEDYLKVLLKNLCDAGYISGMYEEDYFDTLPTEPHITLAGMEYLEENSIMKKTYTALVAAKFWIPGL